MSFGTEHLLYDFGRRGHPLGQALKPEEIPELVQALRRRLDCTEEELDFSPRSLGVLEAELTALHQEAHEGRVPLTEEETVRLIREVAGYLSEVWILHLDARWEDRATSLYGTGVIVLKPVEVVKDGQVRQYARRGFDTALNAAYFWDQIGTGRERAYFQKAYRDMTRMRVRERLRS